MKENIFDFEYIEFKTGGTGKFGTIVRKSAQNFMSEASDIQDALNIEKGLVYITTTTDDHLFGFSFHQSLPRFLGEQIIEERINYPEDIKYENAFLVTTPSFLEAMRRYNEKPPVNPKVIITAGAKLENETYKYALTFAERVIEIYGSTETGIIAYRTSPEQTKMKLFRGVNIVSGEDSTTVYTNYSCDQKHVIGDRVKLDGNYITFLGRSDRLLKILEHRISAPEMENLICDMEEIKESFVFEYSSKIAVIMSLTEFGQQEIINYGKNYVVQKIKDKLRGKYNILPQRFRFIDEIPRKINGKIDREKIEEIFVLNVSYPLILSRQINRDNAKIKMVFLKDSNYFKGHFENFPILPGVVQLFFANYFAKMIFNKDYSTGQIRKIKFTNIIKPNQIVELELNKTESGINFSYVNYSSGILPLKNTLVSLLIAFFLSITSVNANIKQITLPKIENTKCKFEQEKYIPNIAQSLKSSGDFVFEKNKGVIFYTKYPYELTTSYTSKESRDINNILNSFSNGSLSSIEKYYYINGTQGNLVFIPKKNTESHFYIDSINVEYEQKITKISISAKNGTKTIIRWF